jgi:hypothetical protein
MNNFRITIKAEDTKKYRKQQKTGVEVTQNTEVKRATHASGEGVFVLREDGRKSSETDWLPNVSERRR